jgi:hypothetical protein
MMATILQNVRMSNKDSVNSLCWDKTPCKVAAVLQNQRPVFGSVSPTERNGMVALTVTQEHLQMLSFPIDVGYFPLVPQPHSPTSLSWSIPIDCSTWVPLLFGSEDGQHRQVSGRKRRERKFLFHSLPALHLFQGLLLPMAVAAAR